MRSGNKFEWTEQRDRLLIKWIMDGVSINQIALNFGVARPTVDLRMKKLSLRKMDLVK